MPVKVQPRLHGSIATAFPPLFGCNVMISEHLLLYKAVASVRVETDHWKRVLSIWLNCLVTLSKQVWPHTQQFRVLSKIGILTLLTSGEDIPLFSLPILLWKFPCWGASGHTLWWWDPVMGWIFVLIMYYYFYLWNHHDATLDKCSLTQWPLF